MPSSSYNWNSTSQHGAHGSQCSDHHQPESVVHVVLHLALLPAAWVGHQHSEVHLLAVCPRGGLGQCIPWSKYASCTAIQVVALVKVCHLYCMQYRWS